MDKVKFAKAMVYLFDAKLKTCSDSIMQVWFDLLKGYPEERVIAAIMALASGSDQFINPGMVIEKIKPNTATEAEVAWLQALRSAQRAGQLPLTPEAARALKSAGGMMALRDCPEDRLGWFRKDFINAYLNLQYSDHRVTDCPGLNAGIVDESPAIDFPENLKDKLALVGRSMVKA